MSENTSELTDLNNELTAFKEELEELKDKLKTLEDGDNTEDYDQFLNDCYGTFNIGCCEFDASRVLKELDEIAYNCGIDDYNDGAIGDLNTEISNKEQEIKDKEEEIKQVQ